MDSSRISNDSFREMASPGSLSNSRRSISPAPSGGLFINSSPSVGDLSPQDGSFAFRGKSSLLLKPSGHQHANKDSDDSYRRNNPSSSSRMLYASLRVPIIVLLLLFTMTLLHWGLFSLNSSSSRRFSQRRSESIDDALLNGPDGLIHFPPDHIDPVPKRLHIDDPLERMLLAMDHPSAINAQRAAIVKREMGGIWGAYKKYAWGHDELKPIQGSFFDWGGKKSKGCALTIIDSLSTLWLMGMTEEFEEGVNYVTEEVDFDQNIFVSVFESTIRIIGGLLSAYELSGEKYPQLLTTVTKVMDKLLVAYNTSSGIPDQSCALKDGRHWPAGGSVEDTALLSELGSVQLELRTLSFHTKDPKYDIRATHLTDITESQCKISKGLCPIRFLINSGSRGVAEYSLGGNSDSYYEYLLKQYLLTGKTEQRYKQLTLEALDSLITKTLRFSNPSHLAYFDVMDFDMSPTGRGKHMMDHLSCFAGGMYALAADTFPDYKHAAAYREVAERITKTCNVMYEREPSGLCPDSVYFLGPNDYMSHSQYNLQRPETIESMFYQWRYTRDPKYREWAWKIFLSFQKYGKTASGGYTDMSLKFGMPPRPHDDHMQSFFLAETMKYFYLIFSEDDVLDLNEWVLNTEAHPLKIRKRDPLDVWREWEEKHDGKPAFMPPTLPKVIAPHVRTETEQMRMVRGNRIIEPAKDVLAVPYHPDDLEKDDAKSAIRMNFG